MKTLVVAEKPSVGRDIARVLNVKGTQNGYMTGENYVVTWAIGHLVTLQEPDELDEKLKRWSFAHLPILPQNIPLKVIDKTKAQFETVRRLMNDSRISDIVCATDSGREGELIFRYIYEMAGCTKPVMRLWISSMTDAAIKAGFASMKPDSEYDALYLSARCRSKADWLVGMNASRAFTLKYGTLLSVGRVQTPTLGLLVKRDKEIADFVPEDYWELTADFGDYKGMWMDAKTQKTRIPSKEKAEEIQAAVKGKTGTVVESTREEKHISPERLYDLTTLQREANRKFGYSADKTLSLAQSLYETRKLLTYPRTDSRYLPDDMIPKVEKILKQLPEPYKPFVDALNPFVKAQRIYNNEKISDHHAIIPTEKKPDPTQLTVEERNIYDMVTRRLIAAHYPDYVYMASKIITQVENHLFKTTGNAMVNEGWKALYRDEKKNAKDEAAEIPLLQKGDERQVKRTSIKQQKTKPPTPHTDDTLLKAMEDAGKTIEDEALRDEVKDAGLGTPATRAAIITRLIDVGYAKRIGKQIQSTEKGRLFISVAPIEMTSAETTGKWERALSRMARLTQNDEMNNREQRFMDSIRRFSIYLVDYAGNRAPFIRFPEEQKGKRPTYPRNAKKQKTFNEADDTKAPEYKPAQSGKTEGIESE